MWGPRREETNSGFTHLYTGMRTHHATAADGHRNLMLTNLGVSIVFLVCYVVQVSTVGHKSFPGDDWVRVVCLTILTTHTLLAVCLVPLVLRTFFLAIRQRFTEHRRIARITFPIWLYVSVTGVAIYWMVNHLRPYA